MIYLFIPLLSEVSQRLRCRSNCAKEYLTETPATFGRKQRQRQRGWNAFEASKQAYLQMCHIQRLVINFTTYSIKVGICLVLLDDGCLSMYNKRSIEHL
jgi:hypothetical protein